MNKQLFITILSLLLSTTNTYGNELASTAYDATYERQSETGRSKMRTCTDGQGHVRIDTTIADSNKETSLIMDYTKMKSYMLLPDQKVALVLSIAGDKQPDSLMDDEKIKKMGGKTLGSKVIDGHKCRGYSWEKNGTHCESWTSSEVACPVFSSTARKSGAESMRLVKYKAGQPAAENFAIPRGYTEKQMQPPGDLGGHQ